MNFLVDTNICSAYVRGDRGVFGRFHQYMGQIAVSAVTIAELTTWMRRATLRRETQAALDRFLQEIPCLDVTRVVATRAGELRALQRESGTTMPFADLIIAATALVHSLIVVTNNTRDFAGIPGLTLQDWNPP
jgi:tRNA(fMet)-specific endonuclease VapC